MSVGNLSLPLAEVDVDARVPGGGGTVVNAFTAAFALAPKDVEDPDRDEPADGDLEVLHLAAPCVGTGGVRNVLPDRVVPGGVKGCCCCC